MELKIEQLLNTWNSWDFPFFLASFLSFPFLFEHHVELFNYLLTINSQ